MKATIFHSAKRTFSSSEFAIRTGQKTPLLDWLAVPRLSTGRAGAVVGRWRMFVALIREGDETHDAN